jgi:hypothetical protein
MSFDCEDVGVRRRGEVVRLFPEPTATKKARFNAKDTKTDLWAKLPEIAGEFPAHSRLCNGYRIDWREFGKTTQCGWFIENCTIVSFFASRP